MRQISSTIEGRGVTKVITPDPRQALNAVHTLRGSLRRLGLEDEVRWEARRALDVIEDQLRMPHANRAVVADRLERLTELLAEAGGLASTGASSIRRIRAIATWLGPTGAAAVARVA